MYASGSAIISGCSVLAASSTTLWGVSSSSSILQGARVQMMMAIMISVV